MWQRFYLFYYFVCLLCLVDVILRKQKHSGVKCSRYLIIFANFVHLTLWFFLCISHSFPVSLTLSLYLSLFLCFSHFFSVSLTFSSPAFCRFGNRYSSSCTTKQISVLCVVWLQSFPVHFQLNVFIVVVIDENEKKKRIIIMILTL